MKKILPLLFFFFFIHPVFGQDEQNGTARLREKMVEYIQERLNLSKPEAERFQPIFLDYFKELKQTNQEFKSDKLVLQQKIIELRLRYRDNFKPIIGEKRSNEVFTYERDFVNEVQRIRQERMENKPPGGRTNKKIDFKL
jgi:hypothetical protein